MRYLTLILVAVMVTGCASNPLEKRRERILDCTKELTEYDASVRDGYDVCKDLYGRGR